MCIHPLSQRDSFLDINRDRKGRRCNSPTVGGWNISGHSYLDSPSIETMWFYLELFVEQQWTAVYAIDCSDLLWLVINWFVCKAIAYCTDRWNLSHCWITSTSDKWCWLVQSGWTLCGQSKNGAVLHFLCNRAIFIACLCNRSSSEIISTWQMKTSDQ